MLTKNKKSYWQLTILSSFITIFFYLTNFGQLPKLPSFEQTWSYSSLVPFVGIRQQQKKQKLHILVQEQHTGWVLLSLLFDD